MVLLKVKRCGIQKERRSEFEMKNEAIPKFLGSVFFVEDIEKSKKFYLEVLGQKISVDHGRCVGFEGGFSLWLREYAHQIMGFVNSDEQKSMIPDAEIYFESVDIEKCLSFLKAKKVDFVHDMLEQPWGQRCFRLYDPDGHVVEVGEPMWVVIKRFSDLGWSVERIVEKTFMPEQIVRDVVGKQESGGIGQK